MNDLKRFPALDYMSPNDYVKFAENGNIGCPVCRSREIVHQYVNQSSDTVMDQNAFCIACESSWKEEFHMVTYYDVLDAAETQKARRRAV